MSVSAVAGKLSFLIRIAMSVGLIVFMLSRLDLENMLRFLRRADVSLVLATLVAVFVDRAFMVVRWMKLVEALDVQVPRLRVVKIFFLSTFFGSFLPSGIGGEAVRAVSFSRLTSRGVESVASVAMDRLLGLLSMLLMGLMSLTVFYRVYPHPALLGSSSWLRWRWSRGWCLFSRARCMRGLWRAAKRTGCRKQRKPWAATAIGSGRSASSCCYHSACKVFVFCRRIFCPKRWISERRSFTFYASSHRSW